MALTVLQGCVVLLYAVMAARAFQSGTTADRLLGVVLLVGLILIFTVPTPVAAWWLIACAGAYLISQIMTSARMLSRGLPMLAGVLTAAWCWCSEAGLD